MEKPPALVELVNHVPVGDKWLQLGRQLNLDQGVLDQAAQAASSSSYMFQSWLDNNPNATRRDVLVALENIGERTIADRYESWIRAEEKDNNDDKVPVTLHSLVKLLSPIAYKWHQIGVYLNVDISFLESLKSLKESDVVKLARVLLRWMDAIPTPVTWDTIMAAVSEPAINDQRISSEITLFLEKGQSDSDRSSTDPGHTGAADKVPVKLPSLINLLSLIDYKWYEIGLCLNVNIRVLESLRESNESYMMKLSRVLQQWMDFMPTPVTWDTIMDVISGPVINNRRISSEIAQFLEKGQQSDSETEAEHTGAPDEVPVTLVSLMKLLSPIVNQWYKIGDCLNVDISFLESLRMSNESNMVKLARVLQHWIDAIPTPVTWDTIMDVVSGPTINDQRISSDIAQFLEKGQSESERPSTDPIHTGAADKVPVTLVSLLSLLSPIASRWYEIGVCLAVNDYHLQTLHMSDMSNIVKLSRVLQQWMDARLTPVAWDAIMDAVSGPIINDERISSDIVQFLEKGQQSDSDRSSTDPGHTGAAGKVPVTLLSLMKLLSPIADQWYEIGLCLNVGIGHLRSLEALTGSNTMKLSCVLQKCMNFTPVTWDTIMDVVSGPIINDQKISSEIAQFLEKGQSDSDRSSTDPRHTGAADNVPVTLQSLSKLLAPIDYKWHEIGVSLDVSFLFLQSLRRRNESDMTNLTRVLEQKWRIAMFTPVTWDTIMDAVSGPIVNDPETSRKIAQFLEKESKSFKPSPEAKLEAKQEAAEPQDYKCLLQ